MIFAALTRDMFFWESLTSIPIKSESRQEGRKRGENRRRADFRAMKFTAPANSAKMEERPRGFYSARCGALSAPPYRDSFVFAYREVIRDGATRKYDGRVVCARATMESPSSCAVTEQTSGRGRENLSRQAAATGLDLGG